MPLRILFIGDVVGKPGRTALTRFVPELVAERHIDLVIANAENVAGGSGMNPHCYDEIVRSGVSVLTMGDHVYKKKEILPLLRASDRILRPANFPPDAPGASYCIAPARDGTPVAVFTLLGRIFMRPVDCPFFAADRILDAIGNRARVVVLDIHAEATSDKQLIGRYLDGRVSAVLGTHTHVTTADEQVFPGGTAYISDVGMTGPYDSILGRRIDRVLHTTLTFEPTFFDVATGDVRLAAVCVDIDATTGRAVGIERITRRVEPQTVTAGPGGLGQSSRESDVAQSQETARTAPSQ